MKQLELLTDVRALHTNSGQSMVDLSIEITKAIHKARAAGLSRDEVLGVIKQTLFTQQYDLTEKP